MPTTEAEKKDLAVLAELDARPTAPQRAVRSTAQGGLAYVVLDAAQAFGWADVDKWTPDETKAAMALAFALIAAVQNFGPAIGRFIAEWWKSRQEVAE